MVARVVGETGIKKFRMIFCLICMSNRVSACVADNQSLVYILR